MKRFLSGVLAASLAFSALACGSDGPTGPKDPTDLNFAPALEVNLAQMTETSSGLYYQDLVVGDGEEALAGGDVTVHYTGWLHDGTQVDTSVGGDPVSFNLNQVIAGWREGVAGMHVGGKRKLVVPPNLAYGAEGFPGVIPSNATLVFDIELLGVG